MNNEVTTKTDSIQAFIETLPQCELPLQHRFTPGLYSRTITMPKDSVVVSKIHKTEHQFAVLQGMVTVWDGQGGIRLFRAGEIGITKPGTRRILFNHEETVWTTFHATDKTTPEAVEADIIEPHDFDRAEALKVFEKLIKKPKITEEIT
jgi:mannose-6-phosphate isomerase-like protein (cupin superfamily)